MKKLLLILGIGATSYFQAKAQFPAPYCTDTFQYDTEPITLVTFAGINNTTSPTINAWPDQEDFTGTMGTVTQGITYPITLKGNTGGGWTNYFTVFIDWNQDNDFDDASETYNIGSIAGSSGTDGISATGNILVPATATLGTTRMRVYKLYNAYPAGSCLNAGGFGQTEDYTLTVMMSTDCAGVPSAGTASGPAATCATNAANLALSGYTFGVGGITIQWQSSPDGITFSNIGGATSDMYAAMQTDTTFYQAIVGCSFSGMSAISNVVQVTMEPCYCVPTYTNGTSDGDYIGLVEIGTISNTTGGELAPYYTFYSGMSTTMMQGSSQSITISAGDYGTNDFAAWIDFNHDGVFDDVTEKLGETDDIGSFPASDVYNFIVPMWAVPGSTRLRVVEAYNNAPGIDPCVAGSYGETEDYVINITVAPGCTGTPDAGMAVSAVPGVCTGENAVINLSGQTVAAGLSYQWQDSPDGITYSNIASSDSITYAGLLSDTTFFRCIITCTTSGMSDTSDAVQVNLNPYYMCYCTENLYDYEYPCISNVTVNTLNNSTFTCNMPSYTYYAPAGTTTTDLEKMVNYPMSVTDDGDANVSVWIDYDHSGTFDASEWTQITAFSDFGVPSTASINIPNTALLGLTGMRVRTTYNYNSNNANDACSMFYGGETEDYVVNILPAPPCVNMPVGGTLSGPATDSLGHTGTIVLTGSNGDEIQWFVSTDGGSTFNIISGESGSTLDYTFAMLDPTFMAISFSPGCDNDTSTLFTTVVISNDDVCDAFPLVIGTNGPYSTVGATVQPGEVVPPGTSCTTQMSWCNTTLDGTLWFTFVAPPSGRVSIAAPDFDTQLAIWRASQCTDLLAGSAVLVSANDDDVDYAPHGSVQYSSLITGEGYCLTPGATYYVQFDSYGSDGGVSAIVLTDLGPPTTPSLSLNDTLFCGTVTLDAGNDTIPVTYLWSDGSTNQTATFSTNGLVFVTVTDTLNCRATDSAMITNNAPNAGFTSTAVSLGVFNFTNTSTPPSSSVTTTFSWTFGDGGTSAVENPSHIYTNNGVYIVTLTINNDCGTDAITQTVVVNGIGISELSSDNTVKVFPNPATEMLNITSGGNILGVELISATGQRVMTQTDVNSSALQLNVSQLERGMYIVNVITSMGTSRMRVTVIR